LFQGIKSTDQAMARWKHHKVTILLAIRRIGPNATITVGELVTAKSANRAEPILNWHASC
jgi:hypothetical protein